MSPPDLGDAAVGALPPREHDSLERRAVVVAAVVVAGAAMTGALVWTGLSTEWRISILLGGAFLLVTGAIGLPLMVRARNDLWAARRMLLVATERMREAYASLLAVNEQLRQTADARDQALAELRATVRQRESFLEAVAHDLKTPLTVIKGHADLLSVPLARGQQPDRPALERSMERIVESADRMRALIDEMLTLARLQDEAPIAADRQPVDLVALARTVVANAALTTSRHQITLRTELSELVGEWDRQRIERLLANLLANAIGYSPEGGRVTVGIDTELGGSVAVLWVRDEGIGIPAADLDRVFERFHRAANVPGGVAGTGLGLASVRQIVELHGGSVRAESREGEGSTFTVRLPLRPPEQAELESERAAEPALEALG